jgi:hypothetical protein
MLSQCDDCPRRAAGLEPPCLSQYMINDVYCVLARTGEQRWIDIILAWRPAAGPEVIAPDAKASKPRLPLGTKHPPKPGGK